MLVFLFGFVDRQGRLVPLYLIPAYVLQQARGGRWSPTCSSTGVGPYLLQHARPLPLRNPARAAHGEQRVPPLLFRLRHRRGHRHRLHQRGPGMGMVPVVGASGAIFALLLAFAAFFPTRASSYSASCPCGRRSRWRCTRGSRSSPSSPISSPGVAHLTHLAGLAFGYLYLVVRYGINPIAIFFAEDSSRYCKERDAYHRLTPFSPHGCRACPCR